MAHAECLVGLLMVLSTAGYPLNDAADGRRASNLRGTAGVQRHALHLHAGGGNGKDTEDNRRRENTTSLSTPIQQHNASGAGRDGGRARRGVGDLWGSEALDSEDLRFAHLAAVQQVGGGDLTVASSSDGDVNTKPNSITTDSSEGSTPATNVPCRFNGAEQVVQMCDVHFDVVTPKPSMYPKFKDIPKKETGKISMQNARTLHKRLMKKKTVIRGPSGFIFQESRCGSTLVANMLAAVPGTRVFSEAPIFTEMAQSAGSATALGGNSDMAIIMDLMCAGAQRCFFKFQSAASRSYMQRIASAMPAVPITFIYRNPEEVMASHLVTSSAVCLRRGRTEQAIAMQLDGMVKTAAETSLEIKLELEGAEESHGTKSNVDHDDDDSNVLSNTKARSKKKTNEQLCASYMASIRLAALDLLEHLLVAASYLSGEERTRLKHRMTFLQYETLPRSLWKFPVFQGQKFTEAEAGFMKEASKDYSKARGKEKHANGFRPDGKAKRKVATGPIRLWSLVLLNPLQTKIDALPQAIRISKKKGSSGIEHDGM